MNGLQRGKIQLFEPTENIKYSYLVYVPEQIKAGKIILWCHGSTPPDPEDKLEDYVFRALSRIQNYCDKLNLVAVMPILPREKERDQYPFVKYDSQIMTREVMVKDLLRKDKIFYRPDMEILKMLQTVRQSLSNLNISTEEQIIAGGFSAGAVLVNRLSILYSNLISTTLILSAGLFTYPTKTVAGLDFDYPFGVADIAKVKGSQFSQQEFISIRNFIYVGELETSRKNDILPYEAMVGGKELLKSIGDIIGYDPLSRTRHYFDFLKKLGTESELLIGKGLGHEADKNIYDRAFQFIEQNS